MAVSFKVPKSPKRDIFVIDNFMGVDLTNTGSNIDETRSPNAENMVRYVPGKVRKRTGYQTNVTFSDGKDVNRAKNTSDDWITIYPDDFDEDGYYQASDFYETLQPTYWAVEIEAVGEYAQRMPLTECTYIYTTGAHFTGTAENPYNNKRWWFPYNDYKTTGAGFVRYSNGDDDYLKFRCMKVCGDTVATSGSEFIDMPWSPAPEDSGKHLCVTNSSEPVYGCHILRNGNFDGNRVVNVNRALGTSSEFDTFNLTDSSYTMLYELGESVYRTPESDRLVEMIIDFDYILSGDTATVRVAGHGYSGDASLFDTGGDVKHYTKRIPTGSYLEKNVNAIVQSPGTSATLQVKNLSVVYEKNDSFVWSPAPEDGGGKFHTEDLYNVGRDNFATLNAYSKNTKNTSATETTWVQIADANSHIDGFARIAFDIHTDSSVAPSQISIRAVNDHNQWLVRDDVSANVDKKHYEWYWSAADASYYIKYILVEFTFNSTNIDYSIDISNIELNEISPKKNYSISSKNYIYHVGQDFWFRPSNESEFIKICSSANRQISRSWQLNDNLYIIDGKDIYTYAVGDTKAIPLTEIGYIPLVTISKNPDGGGQSYDALNMLQPGFYEMFLVDEAHKTAVTFQLSFGQLDHTETKAWVMDGNGNWVQKKEGTDYSVDRGSGTITFTSAPGKTPLEGEDNVKILAYRTIEGYADRVNKCTVGALFGVGGAGDRLFLSGNPDYPNWDFYSEQFDPTYFPDVGYSVMGSAASAIVGYAIVNNYLAAFKDEYDESQSVFIREGDTVVDQNGVTNPAFKLINTLQGNGVIAPYSFGYLSTEPLFLTRSGVYAITAQDITGEKYSQNRSFYLDGVLTKEENLQNAVAVVFKDQYILAVNGKLYILDGLQATRTDRSEPYATRQYAGFYCTNVPALCMWTDEQALWFGTNDGRVCMFANNVENLDSYNDDGEAIYACWETPDLDGKLFYKNKTFRYFAARLMSAMKTSVMMWSQRLGEWTFIKETTAISKIFDFNDIDFDAFSFRSDVSEKVAHAKVRVKKVDKARFRLENGKLNEPFGLFDLALEYVESGNYKR